MAVHKGIHNLKMQEGGPSRRATHHPDDGKRQSSANSDLSPLKLNEEYGFDEGKKKGSTSTSFWDLDALSREREREKGVDGWMEHGLASVPDERRASGSVIGSLRGGKERRAVDSPIEMVDRTRPW
jgi:hypothetical protein